VEVPRPGIRELCARVAPRHLIIDAPLRDVGKTVNINGDKATAQCPNHDDGRASLSIGPRRDGRGVVVYCHAGCDTAGMRAGSMLAPVPKLDTTRIILAPLRQ
jgi:hypothetical protein